MLMHVTGGGNTCGGMLWQIQDIVQDVVLPFTNSFSNCY